MDSIDTAAVRQCAFYPTWIGQVTMRSTYSIADSQPNEIELPSYPWAYPEPSDFERTRRWNNVRKLMTSHGLDCLVIPGCDSHGFVDAENVLYISNYATYFGRSFVVFPLEGEPFLSLGHPEGGTPEQRKLPARYHSWVKNISASLGQGEEVGDYIKR